MINILRVTLAGAIPYEKIRWYSLAEQEELELIDIFEDSQVYFECLHGSYVVPDYNIRIAHLQNTPINPPKDAVKLKRLLLFDDLNYQNCWLISPEYWDFYQIPLLFKEFEQLVFSCKDGVFVTQDHQVQCIEI